MAKKLTAVKTITITYSEDTNLKGQVFTSWNDANNAIENTSKKANVYCKTDFTVVWEDGHVHKGRIDINEMENNLSDHIENFYIYHSEKPEWESEGNWLEFMRYYSSPEGIEAGIEKSRKFLATYALEDITQEAPMLKAVKFLLTKNTVSETMSILLSLNIDQIEAHNLIIEATSFLANEAKAL